MSWTLAEFLHELEQDSTRRVLFVEGLRDVAFWKAVVPPSERKDTVVYTISEIEVEVAVLGGERGRLTHCAKEILKTAIAGRVLFFADDDCSSLIGHSEPANVVLTDGRDVEAYALTSFTFERMCVTGLARSEAYAGELFDCVVRIGRATGLIRVTSDSEEWDLPFQRTTKKGLSKFILNKNDLKKATLNEAQFLQALWQNASKGLSDLPDAIGRFAQEVTIRANVAHTKIVHGKDCCSILAALLDRDVESVEPMLFLALDLESARKLPNLAYAENWVRI